MSLRPKQLGIINIRHTAIDACRLISWLRPMVSLLLILLATSCSNKSAPGNVASTLETSTVKNILVINTNNSLERYSVSQAAFTKTIHAVASKNSRSITTIDLNMDNSPIDTLQDILNQHHYDAIYCIGAKALGSIDYIDPESRVFFSSVLNWRRFIGQPNYSGIASEVPAEAQLTWFKYFFPEIKKIGVLYSANNRKLIQDASLAAEKLSISIIGKEVESDANLLAHADTLLSNVDALWLISDSTVLKSSDNAKKLFAAAHQHKTPVFSYNPVFVEMGAVLSISADIPTTGRQAALIMNNLLKGVDGQASIQFPAGSSISLNLKRVQEYNIEFNSNALDSVNDIVNE